MRHLFLIVALALAACGGTPPTCLKPVNPDVCWGKTQSGEFFRIEMSSWGLATAVPCECAEWSQ